MKKRKNISILLILSLLCLILFDILFVIAYPLFTPTPPPECPPNKFDPPYLSSCSGGNLVYSVWVHIYYQPEWDGKKWVCSGRDFIKTFMVPVPGCKMCIGVNGLNPIYGDRPKGYSCDFGGMPGKCDGFGNCVGGFIGPYVNPGISPSLNSQGLIFIIIAVIAIATLTYFVLFKKGKRKSKRN